MQNVKLLKAVVTTALVLLSTACGKPSMADASNDLYECGVGACDEKWSDKNYKIIEVTSYNYTQNDIYDVFILPPDKNNMDYGAHASGGRVTPKNETRWEKGASLASLAWDRRWTFPKKFKIWWFKVVDINVYHNQADPNNKYTSKEGDPGTVWCQSYIEVANKKNVSIDKTKGLYLHFYPDGHVEGDLEYGVGVPQSRVDIRDRDKLPVLKDKPCLEQIPNPYYGRKKPVQQN